MTKKIQNELKKLGMTKDEIKMIDDLDLYIGADTHIAMTTVGDTFVPIIFDGWSRGAILDGVKEARPKIHELKLKMIKLICVTKKREAISVVDERWTQEYHMFYGTCPRCDSHCFARLESMALVVHCSDPACGGKIVEFVDELPKQFLNETTMRWQNEMKQALVKYVLKNGT